MKNIRYNFDLIALIIAAILIADALVFLTCFSSAALSAALCAILALLLLVPKLLLLIWQDYKTQNRHMNELVLIAVTAAVAQGDVAGLLTGAAVAFFLMMGLYIEKHSASGAKQALEAVTQLTTREVLRCNPDGSETLILPSELKQHDRVRLRPGDSVPADGKICQGNSAFLEANITGESIPVDKGPNDAVYAGTINLSGSPVIEILTVGENTLIGKVKQLILDAEKTRPALVRMVDVYARFYTPMVLILSFLVWLAFDHDWNRVVTLLVASCPIALVLSTPSAAVATLSAAARFGVLIKNVADIERFSAIKQFIFDKTGTLTQGTLEVAQIAPLGDFSAEQLLSAAASVGQRSQHPVSKAVTLLAETVHVPLVEPADWKDIPGRGMVCSLQSHNVVVGNMDWMVENGAMIDDFKGYLDDVNHGMSLVFVMQDGHAMGWIALRDQVRPDAKQALALLSEAGCHLTMVTGDREVVAKEISAELGLNAYVAHCKPEDKVRETEKIKEQGNVVFVGDGVNDGPALASSDIGVAMGVSGNSLAIETASIALMTPQLLRLDYLRRLSKAYHAVMIQNIIIGACVILSGLMMTLFVASSEYLWIPAVAIASLQFLGALLVVMNSARLLRLFP